MRARPLQREGLGFTAALLTRPSHSPLFASVGCLRFRSHHDEEDELFLVVKGTMVMQFRDRNVQVSL